MKKVILENGFDEFTEQLVYIVLNTIIVFLQATIMCNIGNKTESEMVRIVCLRSIGTVFCGIVIGAALGTYMGSKEEEDLGYIQPDEQ